MGATLLVSFCNGEEYSNLLQLLWDAASCRRHALGSRLTRMQRPATMYLQRYSRFGSGLCFLLGADLRCAPATLLLHPSIDHTGACVGCTALHARI